MSDLTVTPESIEQLIRDYTERAAGFARWLCCRDRRARRLGEDEAVGEAITALWDAAKRYDHDREFWPYARTAVRRCVLKAANKACRTRTVDTDGDGSGDDVRSFKSWRNATHFERAADDLHRAMGTIRPRYRQALLGYYFRNEDARAAAARDRAPSTVRVLLRNARRALRRELGLPPDRPEAAPGRSRRPHARLVAI